MRQSLSTVSKKYNALSRFYDSLWKTYAARTVARAIASAQLQGDEHVYDIGCGTGTLERELLLQFPSLHIAACDISPGMIARAKEKLRRFPSVTFFQGDFLNATLEPVACDTIFSLSNLHYFQDAKAVFAKAAALAKPGARLILIDWSRDAFNTTIYRTFMNLFDKSFQRVYSAHEVDHLLRGTGWKVEACDFFSVRCFWKLMLIRAVKPH